MSVGFGVPSPFPTASGDGKDEGVPREDVPDASSTTRIVQQVGGSFGAAVLAVILTHQLGHTPATAAASSLAFNTAFWWAIGFGVLALVPAVLLPSALAPTTEPQNPSPDTTSSATSHY
jgi:hypothetical protein